MIDGDLKHQMERLCSGLIKFGIDARLSKTWQTEQEIGDGGLFMLTRSLGVINIHDAPICWINLTEARNNKSPGWNEYLYTYYMDYGVPYAGGAMMQKERIFPVRVKTFPIFGDFSHLRWKSGGFGREITNRNNADPLLIHPSIMDTGLLITSYPEHQCWIMSTKEWRVPSGDQWTAYQTLAGYLLAATQANQSLNAPF